jgi:hypothetical protein
MNTLLKSILSVLMTFLSPRYRAESAKLRFAGIAGGLLQTGAAMGYLIYRFHIFFWQRAGIIGPGVDTPSNLPEVNATTGGGVFMMAEFIFNPINAFLLYLFFEGMVRYLAARVSDQIIGTLPLYAISGIHSLIDKAKYRKYVGELVPDEVVCGTRKEGYDLKIYSCRAKLNWNPYIAIEFEGVYYQYFKEEYGAVPRRFIYYLRKQPAEVVAPVVDHYDMKNVLQPEPDKWAGTPTLWDKAFENWNTPPLVPDEVVRGKSRSHYDLKIYSCRRKEDWNTYVTIEFEERWYQLVRDEKGTKTHPFIYYLRKAPQTRPAVVIRKYKGVSP